ncbi:MAG: SAVED domain-containing protein [Armatimonadetes bacterium]|nr:MAG: SAVED domain-containing protein [Armatimonadota bacterium]
MCSVPSPRSDEMALKQVGARTEGDVYQALFFWKQAADLLREGSKVERVVLEHDEADGVDDVAVFYSPPGIDAGGWMVTADYFQLKYHVDQRDRYCSEALIDPTFIRSKTSLLQRFYKAYSKLSEDHNRFRLHFVSNWRWKEDDRLANLLREYDGALPEQFFDAGEKSELGRIREQWRAHLRIGADEFASFARTLRLQLDYFGRRDFKDYVYAKLEAAGLRTPSADRIACPYQGLAQQFLMNGTNSFDRASFRRLCEQQGLLAITEPRLPRPLTVGIRSFVRFAERLDSEVDRMVCVASYFEGRHPRCSESWTKAARKILAFFGDEELRARLRSMDSVLALECHGTFAMLVGWELSRNTGAKAFPIQKPSGQVWRPDTSHIDAPSSWQREVIAHDGSTDDIAVCLSVTHDIRKDVLEYLATPAGPRVCKILVLKPEGGPSHQSIRDANDAYSLASQLPNLLRNARSRREARVHLFFACPNALMFFIGQLRDAVGRLTLYEFDFGFERSGTYQESVSLPLTDYRHADHSEVFDDSEV